MQSLYIHIPFCERKCFYCSFAVSVGQGRRADDYLDCLSKEAQARGGGAVKSVYIGGGTPTCLTGAQLKKLFTILKNNFEVPPDAEWTIEANPESVDRPKLEVLKAHGVNRISLGIQSLNNHYLKYLGRPHDREGALRAYDLIRAAGFENINVDFMFSFPQQTLEEIQQDLREVLRLESGHVSFYMLNLEENSRFFARKLRLPDEDEQARQYFAAGTVLEEHGFGQYEVSNFAKAGRESRHNLHYWQGGEYIGIGMGAHSYRNGKLSWNAARLNNYIEKIQGGTSALEGSLQLDPHEQLKQAVLIGLRMNRGVSVENLEGTIGASLSASEREQIGYFIRHGFLIEEKDALQATDKGRLVLDEICARLM